MVLKTLSERIKKVKASFERGKAKAYGMTVPELRRHLAKRKVEKHKFKEELRRKEREERQKFLKWKVERKYKQKRKQVKSGKQTGALGVLEMFGGSTSTRGNDDPLGIFGPPKRKKKRRKKH